jgi:hypothetical protein
MGEDYKPYTKDALGGTGVAHCTEDANKELLNNGSQIVFTTTYEPNTKK